MAKRVIHELIDDLNGQPADETVTFGLDGTMYTIDLTAKNATKLRDALASYVAAGTKLGRGGLISRRASALSGTGPRTDRAMNQAIRQWARSKRLEVSERGRISQDIVDSYHTETRR
jgi:hypothetical protein